jgi:hypothetical protein
MRKLLGVVLILHGLAHAGAGIWGAGPVWLVTLFWYAATVGFLAAGFGFLGVAPFRRYPLAFAVAGWVASTLLLWSFPHLFVIPGILLDLLLVAAAFWVTPSPDETPGQVSPSALRRVGSVLVLVFMGYVGSVILLRPWSMRYGTTAAERETSLFGDSLYPGARYRVDNAVTIHAPADSVWPWVAQIGQDRGGFYSYALLENLIGARVRNADRIVAAWQRREVGDLVRAVPAGCLGGIFGDEVGWHIVALQPPRGMVLDKWGAFIVRPIDSVTTQLYIRQRNTGVPTIAGHFLAPLGVLVFEPAHFIMQRAMLLGIKRRAERMAA